MFESINKYLYNINESKLLAAFAMLLLNIGSKYIELKISDSQAEYMRNEIGREILIFAMVFVGTKDIILSIIVTAAFIVLANTVFHEDSKYCILPEKYKKIKNLIDKNNDNIISNNEVNKAYEILNKVRQKNIENMTGESLIFTDKNILFN
tara:strand:- start:768 stop:1220 length:453 start_codon:yes stop_codon:yes gene_type:complete